MSEGQSGRFECTACKRSYAWKPELAGRRVKCKCGAVMHVAAAAPVETPAPAPAAKVERQAVPATSSPPASAADEYEIDDAVPVAPAVPRPALTPPPAPVDKAALKRTKNTPIAAFNRLINPVDEDGRIIVEAGRPMVAEDETSLRRRNIIILGTLGILGFLLPIITPGIYGIAFNFPNLQIIGQWGASATTVILMLCPFIAGVAAIALAIYAKPPIRGLALIAAGLLPLGIMLFDPFARLALMTTGRVLGQVPGTTVVTMGLVGWSLCTIGARARWYRPGSRIAFVMGAIGAAAYLIYLVFPLLPKEVGLVPLLLPTFLLRYDALVALALQVAMLFTLGASVLCVVNIPSRAGEAANSFAITAFRLQIGAIAILLAAYGILFLKLITYGAPSLELFLMFTSMMLKDSATGAAILLLIPFGMIDLIIGEPADRAASAHKRRCAQCGYDITGADPRVCRECGARQIVGARKF